MTSRNRPEIDPATTEVIRHYLVSAATEMERTLVRTAYSTIIYEINDFGLSIFDRNFNLLADSTGLPLFLGANEYAIRQTFEHGEFEALEPDDMIFMLSVQHQDRRSRMPNKIHGLYGGWEAKPPEPP